MYYWSKYSFMADSGAEDVSPMSGTKGYSRHQPNNKRGQLVSLFRNQRQTGKEKSQQSPVIPGELDWEVPLYFSLGKGFASSDWHLDFRLALACCLWCVPPGWRGFCPDWKHSCYFWQVCTCLHVLELRGKPLIRHTIVLQRYSSGAFVCQWPDSVAGSSGVCVGTFLDFFVLEEAGKGLTLFRVGEQQLLPWVVFGWGFWLAPSWWTDRNSTLFCLGGWSEY